MLPNRAAHHRCEANKRVFNARRNLWVSLVRKAKKEYFDNLDRKKITDNKTLLLIRKLSGRPRRGF